MYGAFGTDILWQGVWEGKLKGDAVARQKSAKHTVVEFSAIISAECKDRVLKLCAHICMKCNEDLKHVRFATGRKGPSKVRVIIQHNQKVPKARIANDRGSPYITV